MNKFIVWNNVSYTVSDGFFLRKKNIIKDLNLDMDHGAVMGLIGPNGAGKTTTIKLGVGLLRPDSGEVYIGNSLVTEKDTRYKIGYLTENQYVYPYLKVVDWFKLLGKLSGLCGNNLLTAIKKSINLFDLHDIMGKKFNSLSKGQLQRVGLAQALMHDPMILFLDEPMSGLDPVWRFKFKEIFMNLKNEGKTILFSSHIISDIISLSDKITYIDSGQIKWTGNVSEINRSFNKYQAVFFSDDLAKEVKKYCKRSKLDSQNDGSSSLILDSKDKDVFFEKVNMLSVSLELFTPIYSEIDGRVGEKLS